MHIFLQRMYAVFRYSVITVTCLLFCSAGGLANADENTQIGLSLTQVKGNLYRFTHSNQSNKNSGILLIGNEGAAVGNPLDAKTATLLSQLIKEKFDIPVTFVFYTHASVNHGAGASVFVEQGATLVAHANSVHSLVVLDKTLIAPTVVFDDTLTLNLNTEWGDGLDEQVVLRYLGKSATDDMIIAHFPQYDAVFASDFVSSESLPGIPLEQGFFPDWFAAIDKMNRIKYSYFIPGQGEIGIRSDTIAHGNYLRELHNRVSRRLEKGQAAKQIIAEINLRRYRKWEHYADRVQDNVREMIKVLTN